MVSFKELKGGDEHKDDMVSFKELKGGDEFVLDGVRYLKLSGRTISKCKFVNCVRCSDGKLMFIKDDTVV